MELPDKLKSLGFASLVFLHSVYPTARLQDFNESSQDGFEFESIIRTMSQAIFDFRPDEDFYDRIPINCKMMIEDQSGNPFIQFSSPCFIDFPGGEFTTDLNPNYRDVTTQTDNAPDPYLFTQILLPRSQWIENSQYMPTINIEGIVISLIPKTLQRVDQFSNDYCYINTSFVVDIEYEQDGELRTGRLLIAPWEDQKYSCLTDDTFSRLFDI